MSNWAWNIAGMLIGWLAVIAGYAVGVNRGRRFEKMNRVRDITDAWHDGYSYGQQDTDHEAHCKGYREGYVDAKAGKECQP